MAVRPKGLFNFIQESNRIEGMHHIPDEDEMDAYVEFLSLGEDDLVIASMVRFVDQICGALPRTDFGMNVVVGSHTPPPGHPDMTYKIGAILELARNNIETPWEVHRRYEWLHPFMDGNGRSGRALWAWQILHHDIWPHTLELGFLHPAYYSALEKDDE